MGKGMNFLMKRMTEPPTVKPRPKGCVTIDVFFLLPIKFEVKI